MRSTIFTFPATVVAVYVTTIQCLSPWPLSHVGKEGGEGFVPPAADLDASAAVVFPSKSAGSVAPLFEPKPTVVGGRGESVAMLELRRRPPFFAAAVCSDPTAELRRDHACFYTAVAAAKKNNRTLFGRYATQGQKVPKALTGTINKWTAALATWTNFEYSFRRFFHIKSMFGTQKASSLPGAGAFAFTC